MKKSIITLSLIVALIITLVRPALANDEKYRVAMEKNIQAVYEAESITQLQQSVNAFERIGDAEKTKWEPYYYAAFGCIMMATRENERNQKDAYLDQAMATVRKAKAIAPGESEIIALEGFVHMISDTVDPAVRGAQFSSEAMQAFAKAVELNPENPRALALLAQMQFGTAQFFGSSTAEACGTATVALEKFETNQPESTVAPSWGRQMAEELTAQCN